MVDTHVCHPHEYDFYLCSHGGLKGTSRPAHYHVLLDEIGFTPDSLQALSYKMCYLYARATRSVSIVPPVYYAHLAAARGKLLCDFDGSEETRSQYSSAGVPVLNVNPAIAQTMYWCARRRIRARASAPSLSTREPDARRAGCRQWTRAYALCAAFTRASTRAACCVACVAARPQRVPLLGACS